MSIHLQREIEKLKKLLLHLSAMVEENLYVAFRGVAQRDRGVVARIAQSDEKVDRMEVEIEEECLKILALHQPVAIDLRFIVAVLKINNDLERVGDHAVNIVDKIEFLGDAMKQPPAVELEKIFDKSIRMLQASIDAFVNTDATRARAVCVMDNDVDEMKHRIRQQVLNRITECPGEARHLLAIWGIARNAERIADLATNIAEDVIYMIEGNIIRHCPDRKSI